MARGPGREIVVDSSILIDVERRTFLALQAALDKKRLVAVVPVPLLAEVWRGARQASLARALELMKLGDCTETIAKRAGTLLAATAGTNAMDAIAVATAEVRRCNVITGDLKDLQNLAAHTPNVTVGRIP